MASDPLRDLLPVKEAAKAGGCNGIDPVHISRFKRADLEERFIKLDSENSDLKKLNNDLDTKVKKLGTKLLRVISERKSMHGNRDHREEDDDELRLKVNELERENYSLRDKNTVLRQQLANHSRHHTAAHRLPISLPRSTNSPRLPQRNTSATYINDDTVSNAMSNEQNASSLMYREAEAHVTALNDEIKMLNNQIHTLQMELEQSSAVRQKAQLNENIEIIKLRRQNKKIDSQLRVSEHSYKLLEQDVTRLKKENEEALQMIAEKQNEIIEMQLKLDEASKVQLELQELNEGSADLKRERDLLKERCEALMKTVTEKKPETEFQKELKFQLAEVRDESAVLRRELDLLRAEKFKINGASSALRTLRKADSFTQTADGGAEVNGYHELDSQVNGTYNILDQLAKYKKQDSEKPKGERNANPDVMAQLTSSAVNTELTTSLLPKTDSVPVMTPVTPQLDMVSTVEKAALQKEAAYLRDMLRAQTMRSDELENEVARLQQQQELNEERFKDVYQQRDLFYRLLEKESLKAPVTDAPERNNGLNTKSPDSRDCPSANTYTKSQGTGTFTKNSPARSKSSIEGDANCQLIKNNERSDEESPLKNTRNCEVKNSFVASRPVPEADLKESRPQEQQVTTAPVPVPRPRVTSANVITHRAQVHVQPPSIEICILWLSLQAGSRLLEDSCVKALYVDFTFLSESDDNFETPKALPKPVNPEAKASFQFRTNVTWRKGMLDSLRKLKDGGDVVVFNVVSEPDDDGVEGEVECPIVGLSTMSFHQFVFAKAEEEVLLPVYEQATSEKVQCGTLAICLNIAPSVFRDLQNL